MIVVYHVDDETVYFNNGAIHAVIPPNEPVEIENDYDARVLLAEKAFHGLVVVHQVKTKTGVQYDTADAHERAVEALTAADREQISRYVEAQFEDRVKTGRPALPPGKGSRVERLVKKYNVDFKTQFGLDVTSIAAAQAKMHAQQVSNEVSARLAAAEADSQQLREQNTALAEALAKLTAKIDALTAPPKK